MRRTTRLHWGGGRRRGKQIRWNSRASVEEEGDIDETAKRLERCSVVSQRQLYRARHDTETARLMLTKLRNPDRSHGLPRRIPMPRGKSLSRLHPTWQDPQTTGYLISPSRPPLLSQPTIPLTHTLVNHTLVKTSSTTNIHSVPIMAAPQPPPPLPNVANLRAAVNGMTAEGDSIAQSFQRYNAHQQALNTELSLCGNYDVARIQQQLTTIEGRIVDLTAWLSAE
jgi:hypothetical protein